MWSWGAISSGLVLELVNADANKGNLLLGDGKGGFQSIGNTISGLKINGEIRDIEILTTGQNNQIILFAKNNELVEVYNINPAQKN